MLERFKLSLLICLATLIGSGLALAEAHPHSEVKYIYERPQMGVPFRLVFYSDQGEVQASNAAEAVWKRISNLNAVLSNYETDSELSRLGYSSGQGTWVKVSEDLWQILSHAQHLSVKSAGAFDFTLGPATALWRKVRREKRLPTADTLASMMSRTGWQRMVLCPEDRSVCLTVPDMRLDPGGIAKGFALDEGLKVLEAFEIQHALLSGGGDMATLDGPPGTDGWKIRLADFNPGLREAGIIELSQGAIATSGDLFQFVEIGGRRYSHILHPATGV